MSTQNGCSLATFLVETRGGHTWISKFQTKHGGDGKRWPHPIPHPCALALTPRNHRDATTHRPCWAPHFITQQPKNASCSRFLVFDLHPRASCLDMRIAHPS